MYPVICRIGPLSIYSYGFMLAMAVVVCSYLLSKDAQKNQVKPEVVYDLVFWIVVGGIIGARLFFIVLNLQFFIENPSEIIKIHNGGLSFQGSVIFGGLAAVWTIRKHKLKPLLMLDMIAPYLALGQSLGRVGCYLNGCCYGRHAHWGVFFPYNSDVLHPTQLYSTIGLFFIFVYLLYFRNHSKLQGKTFVMYLMLASSLRFVVEFYRGDHFSTFLGLSIYQHVSLGIFCAGSYVYTKLKSFSRAQ